MSQNKILFVIAALNEEKNIPHVLRKIQECFADADILVVDGYSSDKTCEVSTHNHARVIQVSKAFGIGGAIEAGMLYAHKYNYETMIRIDADGQHEPSEVKRLYEIYKREGLDLLIGSRYLGNSEYKPNLLRHSSIVFISWLMQVCYGVKITDCTSGCHIYSNKLFGFFARDFNFNYSEIRIICLAHKLKFKIKEDFINMKDRLEGVSTFSLKNAFFYVFTNVTDIIFTMPLKLRGGGHES